MGVAPPIKIFGLMLKVQLQDTYLDFTGKQNGGNGIELQFDVPRHAPHFCQNAVEEIDC